MKRKNQSDNNQNKKKQQKIRYDFNVACETNKIEIVKQLIKNVDLNEPNDNFSYPLNLACAYGNVEITKELISNGADVNVRNLGYQSSLILACMRGHINVVRELIKHGANWNELDMTGCSALDYAVFNKHIDIVIELLTILPNSLIDTDIRKAYPENVHLLIKKERLKRLNNAVWETTRYLYMGIKDKNSTLYIFNGSQIINEIRHQYVKLIKKKVI
jgi:ankyrin repeat protein